MAGAAEGTLLWKSSEAFKKSFNITRYTRWLKKKKNLSFTIATTSFESGW